MYLFVFYIVLWPSFVFGHRASMKQHKEIVTIFTVQLWECWQSTIFALGLQFLKIVAHFSNPANSLTKEGGQWTPKLSKTTTVPKPSPRPAHKMTSNNHLYGCQSESQAVFSCPERAQEDSLCYVAASESFWCRLYSRVGWWWSREPGIYTSATNLQLHQTQAGRPWSKYILRNTPTIQSINPNRAIFSFASWLMKS